MKESTIEWRKYPEEKPINDTCKYIVIYDWYGEYKSIDCVWVKGKFAGVKNSLVKAWAEMPYAMLRRIYV